MATLGVAEESAALVHGSVFRCIIEAMPLIRSRHR